MIINRIFAPLKSSIKYMVAGFVENKKEVSTNEKDSRLQKAFKRR